MSVSVRRQKSAEDVHWDREDDGAVVDLSDAFQRLEVAELDSQRVVSQHVSSVTESSAGSVFPLSSDHLGRGSEFFLKSVEFSIPVVWKQITFFFIFFINGETTFNCDDDKYIIYGS